MQEPRGLGLKKQDAHLLFHLFLTGSTREEEDLPGLVGSMELGIMPCELGMPPGGG